MSDPQMGPKYALANGGAVLAAGADPNVTPPPDTEVFRLTSSRPNPVTDGWYAAAKGGSPTVTIWMKADGLGGRWMALSGATALVIAADVVKTFALGSIPFNRDLFVQVTAVNACTGIELGVTQQLPMFIPDRFVPTQVNHQTHYDEEGRLRTFRIGRSEEGGISEANSLYATHSEYFDSTAPFLKAAKIKDAQRRNYIIQPGGACIYFKEDQRMHDPYDHNRVQYTAPSPQESFGHNSMDGTKMSNAGVQFTVGMSTGGIEPHK